MDNNILPACPKGAVLIEVCGGSFAIVDAEDERLARSYSWCKGQKGLAARARNLAPGVKGGHVKLHRVIMGAAPSDIVDHINGDFMDNRRCNLRLATNRENSWNRKSHTGSSSKFKGVSKRIMSGRVRFPARIRLNGVLKHLGTFDDEETAARAYDAAAIEHFGEFARLNFPEDIPGANPVKA